MFKLLTTVITSVVLAGLVAALLTVFEGDLGAIIEWIFSLGKTAVDAVASFFMSQEWFHNLTS